MAAAFQRGDQFVNQADARTVRTVLRFWRALRWAGYSIVLACVCAPVLAWLLLHTQWATQQVVPHIPAVEVVEPRGAFLGDFSARRIDIHLPRGSLLRLDQVAWRGLSVYLDPRAQWYTGLHAKGLSAEQVTLNWVPNPHPGPTTDPYDLRLPLTITVERLQAQRGVSALWGPFDLVALDGRLELGQLRHWARIDHLDYGPWTIQGDGRVRTQDQLLGELQLKATGTYSHAQGRWPVQGQLQAKGPLTQLALSSQWVVGEAQAKQSLNAKARLTLWAPWVLPELQAQADRFDLAALSPTLPKTSFTGKLGWLDDKGDLKLDASLKNSRPGVWDQGMLPVRQVQAKATLQNGARAHQWRDLLQAVDLNVQAVLPGSDAPVAHVVGRWGMQGGEAQNAGQQLSVSIQPTSLRTLHSAAPDLTLASDVSARAAKSGTVSDWANAVWSLQGRLMGSYRPRAAGSELVPVSTRVSGQWQRGELKLQEWVLQAQEAQARLAGQFGYEADARSPMGWRWDAQASVDVAQFDPKVWMPWPAALKGRNRLMGRLEMALDSSWLGQAKLDLKPSELAGLPVAGLMTWSAQGAAKGAPAGRAELDWRMVAAGNRVEGQARLPWRVGPDGLPRVKGDQSWQALVDAPALGALSDLGAVWGVDGLSGRMAGRLDYQGQWPDLQSSGQLNAKQVRWQTPGRQTFQLDEASAKWLVSTRDLASPLMLDATLRGLNMPALRVEDTRLHGHGSLRDHQLSWQVLGQVVPASGASGSKTLEPMQVRLAVQGAASTGQGGIHAWRGAVRELNWQTANAPIRTWLSSQPFALNWTRAGDAHRVAVETVQLSAMGVPLRVQDLSWQTQADVTRALAAQVVLEPFKVAQVLNQWQPQTGWGGDLTVSGRMDVAHSPEAPWRVQAQVAKVAGDLTLSEPSIEGNSMQRLGIDVASLGLTAKDGLWVLTQVFEGSVLGRLSGRQSIQVADRQRWPAADDALSGALDVSVSSLRPWAAWVPAGWRLQGQVEGHAELSGTVGKPQYVGTLRGRQLQLNQALMGVNLTDGTLVLDLQGDQAYLREFTAKGGALGGTVRATGQANLGGHPEATLQVQAERFALLQRIDRRLLISGQAQAKLTEAEMALQGKVQVDEGLFDFSRSDAPVVGDDVNVVNGPGARRDQEEDVGDAGANRRNVVAVVDISLGERLRLKGRGLETDLTGNLKFTTPNNRPRLHGTVRAANGTYAAYGQKLVIDRGAITFTGPVENPRLDILAMRKQSPMAASSDVKVGVAITGTAQDPRVSLYSEPAMSETDKLSWLVLGRAPSGLGGADIGLLQSAAVALLSGEGPSTTDNIMSSLGLDELSVRQSDGTVRETVVNVGKQLSKYWYVGYERNLNATSGNWQLIYRLAQRFTLRAQTGIDNAVDLIWSWRWD
ncbi:MAG: translocation/assembly module TamB domain-containing protein [Aquabacterium sp.]